MHWFDDVIFEQYSTWNEIVKAQIFLNLDLYDYFGGSEDDDVVFTSTKIVIATLLISFPSMIQQLRFNIYRHKTGY